MARWMEGGEEEERGGGGGEEEEEEEAPTTADQTTWELCNMSGVITKPSRMLRLVLSEPLHSASPQRSSAPFNLLFPPVSDLFWSQCSL